MAVVNPYLTFNGNCEEAFTFYKSAFGGDFAGLMRFSEMPADQPVAEGEGNLILHVALPIGKGTLLMGSDRPEAYGDVSFGGNFSISISADSKDEATRLFNDLSAGGRVTMPLEDAFWGDYFGMLTDQFGINWMVSYSANYQN
jgi:PhnB protein